MNTNKICAGMMVKNEERDLPALLESIRSVVDRIVILDTGSTDGTAGVVEKYILEGLDIQYIPYLKASECKNGEWFLLSFSKARNEYLRIISEMQDIDWVVSFDADDTLLDIEKFKQLSLNDYDVVSFKIAPDLFTQHRMWRSKLGIKYEGAVHEYPTIGGFRCLDSDIRILHNYAPGIVGEGSNDRNLRILIKEQRKSPTTRNTFYLANTYKDRSDYENAIKYYTMYLAMKMTYRDEWLFAVLYKARSERALGKIDDAINTLLKGTLEEKNWAEFWMEIAYIYYNLGLFEKCIGYCYIAISCTNLPTSLWREVNKYTDQPKRLISWCYEHLGNKVSAIEWAYKAKEAIGGPDQSWDDRIKRLETKRIALNRPGAIGDVIMTLNLIGPLKEKYPGYAIDYYTSAGVKNSIDYLMLEAGVDEIHTTTIHNSVYEKTFNLIGYPVSSGYPYVKMQKHLLEYFADEVGVKVDLTKKLQFSAQEQIVAGGYVTIHPKAGWSKWKNWPIERWEQVVADNPGVFFVQIGSKGDPHIKGTVPYMGASMKDSIALIANAQVHMGVDSFSNHVTHCEFGGKSPKAIILWGSTQYTAAGYDHNINFSTGLNCQPCFREDPGISIARTDECPNQVDGVQKCMYGIPYDRVSYYLKQFLKG